MSYGIYLKKRSGFAIVELLIGVIVLAVIALGVTYYNKQNDSTESVTDEEVLVDIEEDRELLSPIETLGLDSTDEAVNDISSDINELSTQLNELDTLSEDLSLPELDLSTDDL